MKHMSLPVASATAALALIFLTASPGRADAQVFASGFVGGDFGGNAGCPDLGNLSACDEKKVNWGGGVGVLGKFLGFEEEVSYAPEFFGQSSAHKTSVLTVMSNLLVGPRIGALQPYVTGGLGLMKTNVDFTSGSLVSVNNNSVAWDAGVGLIANVTDHLGVRADYRFYRSIKDFDEFDLLGVTIDDSQVNYNRLSGGVVVRF